MENVYKIYVPRKSVYNKVNMKLATALEQSLDRKEKNDILGVNNCNSFSIIGTSGSGKTSLIQYCISQNGNSLRSIHTDGYDAEVLPFLYLNCPPDCSIKSLLYNILQEIDNKLDTNYIASISIKFTTEQLFNMLLSAVKFIGVLILDECQNLAKFKAGNTLINYLTALANSGLAVCISGTEELIPFLSSDISLSRRYQPIMIKPYEFDDEFKELVSKLLLKDVDDMLMYWLYIHSAGLPAHLVEIIYEANGSYTLQDFESVYDSMIFKPVLIEAKPIKTVSNPKYLPARNNKEPINLVQMLNDKSIDMLSVLKSNYEVVEL